MKSSDKQLTLRIAALRKAIKQKYRLFKDGNVESQRILEKQYQPIIQELRKTNVPEPDTIKKEEPMDYDDTQQLDEQFESEEEEFVPPEVSTPKNLSELVSTPSKTLSTTQFVDTYFKNPITAGYMNTFMRDAGDKKVIDYTFGPRYVNGNSLMIGSEKLDFDEDGNIKIGGVNYGASPGLYELLFKRVPDAGVYDEEDSKTYKSILIATNAHREGYMFKGKMKSSRGTKYTKIIKPLFPTIGKGLAWKNAKTRDIIYWDDPNELVHRLKLLLMSAESGNGSHGNEILSIIDELREAGFIKGAGNSRFKSLLE